MGIDYGMGKTNIDSETGIRYGVISQHSVGSWALQDMEYDYGPPTCPYCGGEVIEISEYDEDTLEGFMSEPYECDEYVCISCERIFGGESAFGEAIGMYVDNADYTVTTCLDSDLMVTRSPYFTYAEFCSPCVPGAGNLDQPDRAGPKTYCLGYDWFDEDNPCPYPIYSIETGELIVEG